MYIPNMQTGKPKTPNVQIVVREFKGAQYKNSQTIRVYDATAKKIMEIIKRAIVMEAQP